ncbi:MAG: transketolase, partial [Candidatus Omnitrophica bacterium]|nr:transketolase [Candidatus Omnitrophota bacterium]
MELINNTIYQGKLNNGQEYSSKEELIRILSDYAVDIRKKIVELTNIAVGAHIGGSLSCVELLIALYFYVLNIKPSNPNWEERDRFILSKGHSALAFFPILAQVGFFPEEKMKTFNQLDSAFGMHPDMHRVSGVEVSTGSLGHGFSIAVGAALGAKVQRAKWRVYVLLGDGENQEGSVWEAAMSASHYKLNNLIAIVDRN